MDTHPNQAGLGRFLPTNGDWADGSPQDYNSGWRAGTKILCFTGSIWARRTELWDESQIAEKMVPGRLPKMGRFGYFRYICLPILRDNAIRHQRRFVWRPSGIVL